MKFVGNVLKKNPKLLGMVVNFSLYLTAKVTHLLNVLLNYLIVVQDLDPNRPSIAYQLENIFNSYYADEYDDDFNVRQFIDDMKKNRNQEVHIDLSKDIVDSSPIIEKLDVELLVNDMSQEAKDRLLDDKDYIYVNTEDFKNVECAFKKHVDAPIKQTPSDMTTKNKSTKTKRESKPKSKRKPELKTTKTRSNRKNTFKRAKP